jgi:RES domain-containing protein
MIVFRISKKAHIQDLLGIGAGLYGGRWNPKGINMVYTSSSIALASLEYLVHNYHLLSTAEICLAKIKISKPRPIMEYNPRELPSDWHLQLKKLQATQQIGKEFYLRRKNYILKVPSAVVPQEFNLLLNPLHNHHPHTKVIEIIDPFVFDQRLLNLV